VHYERYFLSVTSPEKMLNFPPEVGIGGRWRCTFGKQ